MTSREKILALIIGGVFAVVGLGALVSRAFLQPAEAQDKRAADLRLQNEKLRIENARMEQHKEAFTRIRDATFDANALNTPVMLNAWVNDLARQAGLGAGDVSVAPFNDKVVLRSYKGKGYTVSSSRPVPLDRLTNFLFVLAKDPKIHRVTSFWITPQAGGKNINFSLGCATVTLDEDLPRNISIPPRATTQPEAMVSLNSAERDAYNVIPKRNIFAPYAPPVAVAPTPRPPSVPPRVTPPEDRTPRISRPDPTDLMLTGLPFNGAEAEVHLSPPGQPPEKILKVGEKIPLGEIAAVDYRAIPLRDNPNEISYSRLILKIKNDYWAVELGQHLSQRRILKTDDLPGDLKPKPLESLTTATMPTK